MRIGIEIGRWVYGLRQDGTSTSFPLSGSLFPGPGGNPPTRVLPEIIARVFRELEATGDEQVGLALPFPPSARVKGALEEFNFTGQLFTPRITYLSPVEAAACDYLFDVHGSRNPDAQVTRGSRGVILIGGVLDGWVAGFRGGTLLKKTIAPAPLLSIASSWISLRKELENEIGGGLSEEDLDQALMEITRTGEFQRAHELIDFDDSVRGFGERYGKTIYALLSSNLPELVEEASVFLMVGAGGHFVKNHVPAPLADRIFLPADYEFGIARGALKGSARTGKEAGLRLYRDWYPGDKDVVTIHQRVRDPTVSSFLDRVPAKKRSQFVLAALRYFVATGSAEEWIEKNKK